MAFTVVYDACVLYPAPLRDLLIRIANSGLVRARWTERILDECFRSILRDRDDLDPRKLARTRELMNEAVPDCLVRDFDDLIERIELPDSDDRHVVAAAIRAGAQVIVTFNLPDFPAQSVERYGIEAQHPDDFVLSSIDLSEGIMIRVIEEQLASLRNPPQTRAELLDTLRRMGLVQAVARLREIMS